MTKELVVEGQYVLAHPDFKKDAEIAARGFIARRKLDAIFNSISTEHEGSLMLVHSGRRNADRTSDQRALLDYAPDFLGGETVIFWPITRGRLSNKLLVMTRPCEYDEEGNINRSYPLEYSILNAKGKKPRVWDEISEEDEAEFDRLITALDQQQHSSLNPDTKTSSINALKFLGEIDLENAIEI